MVPISVENAMEKLLTFWQLFTLAMGTAAVFGIVLALSSWVTNRIMDWQERRRKRQ